MTGIAYITNINTDTLINPSNGIDTYIVDANSGDIIITLPEVIFNGMKYKFKRSDTTINKLYIYAYPGQVINGQLYIILYRHSNVEINSFNYTWYTVGGNYSDIIQKAVYNLSSIEIVATSSTFQDIFYFPWINSEYNNVNRKYVNAMIMMYVENIDILHPPMIRVIDSVSNILAQQIIPNTGKYEIIINNDLLPNIDTYLIIQIENELLSTTIPSIKGSNIEFDII